jgi:putative oxidoreductase
VIDDEESLLPCVREVGAIAVPPLSRRTFDPNESARLSDAGRAISKKSGLDAFFRSGGYTLAMLAESNRFGIAILLLRVVIGFAFVLHGTPKIAHASTWMDGMAFHPPALLQEAAAVAEFFGGIALIAGVASRIAATLIGIDMLVALAAVHVPAHAPLVSSHGESLELPAVYLIGAFAIVLVGPGRWSADALIARCASERRRQSRRRAVLS